MFSVKIIREICTELVPQTTSELGGVGELAEGVVPQHLEEHISLGWIEEVEQIPFDFLRRRRRTPTDFATERGKRRPTGPPIPGIRCPDNETLGLEGIKGCRDHRLVDLDQRGQFELGHWRRHQRDQHEVLFVIHADCLERGRLALPESKPRAVQQPVDITVQRMLSAFHSATIPDLPRSVVTCQELLSPEHRRP